MLQKMKTKETRLTWNKGLRNPHRVVPADPEHAASEDVGGSANDSYTGQCASKELHLIVGHVHLYQHRGHHKHQKDDEKRRQDPHIWRQPTETTTTHTYNGITNYHKNTHIEQSWCFVIYGLTEYIQLTETRVYCAVDVQNAHTSMLIKVHAHTHNWDTLLYKACQDKCGRFVCVVYQPVN